MKRSFARSEQWEIETKRMIDVINREKDELEQEIKNLSLRAGWLKTERDGIESMLIEVRNKQEQDSLIQKPECWAV